MNFFNRQRDSTSTSTSTPSYRSDHHRQLTTLLARIESSTLGEDKHSALEELRELIDTSSSSIQQLDPHLIHALIHSIQHVADDFHAARIALDIITILLVPKDVLNSSTKSRDLVGQYVSNPVNVTTLLDATVNKDAYLRYNIIQLLLVLLHEKSTTVQTIVLNHAMGVNLIMDLLDDNRELIKNESLLLLEALTRDNSAIQKIVGFGNGFDCK
jgi:hypothetical protein